MSDTSATPRSGWTHDSVARSLMRAVATTVTAVVAGLALAAPATADQGGDQGAGAPPTADHRELQQALDQLVADGAPGALLYRYDNGHVTSLRSGVANIAAAIPMRMRYRYRIGSITKTMVATAVLDLVAKHQVHLDDRASRYLPDLLAGKERITVRQLLNNTSGLYEFNDDPRVLAPYLKGNLGHIWTPRRLVQIALSHEQVATPGAAYHYSNTNYVLAGLIIQKVTGHRLGDVLRDSVFSRAHLKATTFTTARKLPAPAAHGYFAFPGDEQPTDITSFYPYPWAAGAAVSTAPEVARFYRHLLSGRLLPRRMMAAMRTTVDASDEGDPGEAYGLGLGRLSTPCGPAWGHAGQFPGYVNYAYSSPDGSRQIVLMLNEDPSSLAPAVETKSRQLFYRSYCRSHG